MQPTFKRIPLDNIHPGPIRHNKLAKHLVERAKRFHEKLSEVDEDPLEKVVEDFRRDVHPEREVAIWEQIATAYQDIISRHPPLPLAEKKRLYRELISASVGG